MGRLKAKSDYEELRNARISANKARLASLGVLNIISELQSVSSAPKSKKPPVTKFPKLDYSSTPLRRSARVTEEKSKADLKKLNSELGVSENEEAKPAEVLEMPKRPPSAFYVFMEYFRKQHLEMHPKIKCVATVGILGDEMWKSLSDEEKAPCVALSEKRKEQYRREMEAYERKLAGHGDDDDGAAEDMEIQTDPSGILISQLIRTKIGRPEPKSAYEELREARISENQARMASLGLSKTIFESRPLISATKKEELRKACISENQARLASFLSKTDSELQSTSKPKSEKSLVRKWCKVDYTSNPLRRSSRLGGNSQGEVSYLECDNDGENGKEKGHDNEAAEDLEIQIESLAILKSELIQTKMGGHETKSDYEELRKARISENQARLASLGLSKTISELRFSTSAPKPKKSHDRKLCKVVNSSTPMRRSSRLGGNSQVEVSYLEYYSDGEDVKEKRNTNGRLVGSKRGLGKMDISAEALARRCESKGRGSLYNPTYGICCHFCRQKKLCGEDDCKHCGELDMDQPCIGKTDCSVCHSSNGIFCRACLKVRYGEELEDVRANKDWICPHCTEKKGINLYWICNSSICLKKRKMVPTGIAIFRAKEMGFKSVAHLLMDELQRAHKAR